jgi:hypothetical protein
MSVLSRVAAMLLMLVGGLAGAYGTLILASIGSSGHRQRPRASGATPVAGDQSSRALRLESG